MYRDVPPPAPDDAAIAEPGSSVAVHCARTHPLNCALCAHSPIEFPGASHTLHPRFTHTDTGRLEDGTVFDSSLERGPFEFTLGRREVIRGWDQGVAGMRVGAKRQLVVPPHLGYGASGAPPVIPPNALLHFDVELVSVGTQDLFGRLASMAKAVIK